MNKSKGIKANEDSIYQNDNNLNHEGCSFDNDDLLLIYPNDELEMVDLNKVISLRQNNEQQT